MTPFQKHIERRRLRRKQNITLRLFRLGLKVVVDPGGGHVLKSINPLVPHPTTAYV